MSLPLADAWRCRPSSAATVRPKNRCHRALVAVGIRDEGFRLDRHGAARAGFAPLDGDVTADVAVIGGGIVGITTALLLHEAGARVVLLEAGRLGPA